MALNIEPQVVENQLLGMPSLSIFFVLKIYCCI